MKLLALKLIACGPFTGQCLDLSEGSEGLHVVYGPNEAGKSSALRAISDFLFGFHTQTRDNFVHAYKQLRIGAELRHSSGKVLDCVRRKGNQKTLRQADDAAPLDDRELSQLLGDLDRDKFLTMFGLNHDRLREGGAMIVQGGGSVGHLLFAAGAGLADLRAVQAELNSKADELFKSPGRSGALINDIKQYQDLRSQLKDAQVSVETWNRQEELLRSAESQKQSLDETLRVKRARLSRLTRIRDGLPTIRNWRKATEELASFGDMPELPDTFAETSNQAILNLKKSEVKKADAEASLENLQTELASINVSDELLARADAIESLRDRFGGYRKALEDRPGLETERALAEADVEAILKRLSRPPERSEIEVLRLPADKTVRIQNLGNQREGLLERFGAARRDCDRLRREIQRLESELRDTTVPTDVGALVRSVRLVQNEGDVEAVQGKLDAELHALRQEALLKLPHLSPWAGGLDDVEKLAVPSLATIDQFDQQLREAAARVSRQRESYEEQQLRRDELAQRLVELEREQAIPTQQDLVAARRLRDHGWQLVLTAWKSGRETGSQIDELVQGFAPAESLREAYRRSVEDADQIADALRNDADRVATKAKLVAERDQQLSRCERLAADVERAQTAWQEIQDQWISRWSDLKLTPLSPLEMRDWIRKQQELAGLAGMIRTRQGELEQQRQRVAALQQQLLGILTKSGIPTDGEPAKSSLRELLSIATESVEALKKAESQRLQLASTLADQREELAQADARRDEAEVQLSKWRTNWAAEMQRLGLQEDADPAQANSVLTNIAELFQKSHVSDGVQTRIAGIDLECSEFEREVRDLGQRLPIEFSGKSVQEWMGELTDRLRQARLEQDRWNTRIKQRSDEEHKLRVAERTIAEVQAELDEMCRQARCSDYQGLQEAARRAARYKNLREQTQDLEQQLVMQSGGATLESFVAEAEVEARDVDALQARIVELESELDRCNGERDTLLRQIERESTELAKIDGGAVAADKAAQAEGIAARLEENLREFAVLRAASTILSAGIERYREKNQDPVLERAGRLFSQITEGAFQGLRVDLDSGGKPVLVGVRRGSEKIVYVEEMSDGTCDQLYLALRLASLDTWLTSGPSPRCGRWRNSPIARKLSSSRITTILWKWLGRICRRASCLFITLERKTHEHVCYPDQVV